jgi:hypothetical protein
MCEQEIVATTRKMLTPLMRARRDAVRFALHMETNRRSIGAGGRPAPCCIVSRPSHQSWNPPLARLARQSGLRGA